MADRPSILEIYWILMKIRVVLLLQATAICGVLIYDFKEGYDSGRDYADSLVTCAVVLIGGSLASGGSMAINMWYERDIDPLMERTVNRPIPSGYISPNHALAFGLTICLLATPPAIGWAAASGDIDSVLPWLMVLTIFMWTPPHFWSLTLSKRRDYGEAGVPMLPVVRGEDVTRNHIAGYTVALIFTNLLIYINGETGLIFLISSMLLSGYFAFRAFSLRKTKSEEEAWNLFKFSNVYLYTLFISLVIDAAYMRGLG